ncbi:hypothetical protein BKA58DRAFT_6907 [Alternaria rosae]|uniref:uncharacterized protein n=1 Tax=Alternaria rosae TaxID=1187941 RepID=UPI001E8D1023|nr:uncharacterized protein BKA58DRAFT_6907 [Alternaria rosae]KAH6881705.1 hypothetical protein BKA58DRAFT_6907 [Alternaria rosae]
MTPVPLSSHSFGRIAPFARIPEIYARVLDYKAATYVFANPQLPLHLARTSPKDVRSRYLSFILQSVPGAMSHVCISGSFTYDFSTKHMYVFMHGLASNNYDRFSNIIQEGASSTSAFLLPSIIVRFNLEQRVKALNLWQDKIYWHERRVGIRFDHHDNPELSSIDFSTLSKDLNAANTNLAYVMWSCKSTTRMLDFLDQIAKRYKQQAIANKISEDDAAEIEQLLVDAHAQMRSWNAGLEDRADYLAKRGQALVQTVYSGIAQRDSAISLKLASTSMSLAQSSRSIALSTSRDSRVMRIIAAITVFFLPATFTATFFSTTFFDFKPNQDEKIYSQWIWLYFVVTIILNLTVFFGTWYVWRKKELEIMASFSSADKEPEAQTVETSGRRLDLETAQYVEQEIGHAAPGVKSRTKSKCDQSSQQQTHYAKTETSAYRERERSEAPHTRRDLDRPRDTLP